MLPNLSIKRISYITLIFIIVIDLSSSQNNYGEKSNREYTYESTNNNTSTSYVKDPASYLIGWFCIFIFMALYIICKMKKIPQFENKTDDVWKFLFFANNGIFIAAGINAFNIRFLYLDASPLALSGIVFLYGCIHYLIKYIKFCNKQNAYIYFSCDKLNELFGLPCSICLLIGLTDPCCKITTYTVTVYSDGHTESTECWVRIINFITCLIKKLATFFSIVSYYIFFLFYLIFWLIGKFIFSTCINKCGNEPNPQTEPQPQIQVQTGMPPVNDIIINQNIDPNNGNQFMNYNIPSEKREFYNNNNNINEYEFREERTISHKDVQSNNDNLDNKNIQQNNNINGNPNNQNKNNNDISNEVNIQSNEPLPNKSKDEKVGGMVNQNNNRNNEVKVNNNPQNNEMNNNNIGQPPAPDFKN